MISVSLFILCSNSSLYNGDDELTFSAGLGLAMVRPGWMMLAVLGVNHAFSPAQTGELG